MRGKSKESHYVITKLFATDYFYFYGKPILFFTYFLPYRISKNGKFYTYDQSEFEKKLKDIRELKFGKYGNYASQGFGNVAFYEPCVKFTYFYNELCLYDGDKNKYFNIRKNDITSIEDASMKEDLRYILKDKSLLLKKNFVIPEGIKKELLKHLEYHENKYVLAELIYYIVSEEHVLPDIETEERERQKARFDNSKIITNTNIFIADRVSMDERRKSITSKVVKAREVQVVCINGNSFLEKNKNGLTFFEEIVENRKKEKERLKIEIVVEEPASRAEKDACEFKENFKHRYIEKNKLVCKTLEYLELFEQKNRDVVELHVKTTCVALPYAIFIVKNEDRELDYIKVDLYSPYILDKKDRLCFYIFRNVQQNLYKHFQTVFYNIWNDDKNSKFVIGENYVK